MISVIRQHLPPARAHILAGVLSSAGIKADVWGDQAAHIYGELVTGGCSVAIDDEYREEAEALLASSDFAEEPATDATQAPAESCPPNGDLPSIGVILYGTMCLAPLAAIIPAVLVGIRIYAAFDGSLRQILTGMIAAYFQSLLVLACLLPMIAFGAGLLLLLIPAHRRGEPVFALIAKVILLVVILGKLLSSA